MNSFIAVILCTSTLAIIVQGGLNRDEAMAVFRTISMTCKEESGAQISDIEALINKQPAGSMEAKCLRACILKKIDVMDANGKLVKDVAMKIGELHTQGDATKMKIADEIMDICKDITVSDNHCLAAEQYEICVKDEAAKRGLNTHEF